MNLWKTFFFFLTPLCKNDECVSVHITACCCNEEKQFWFTVLKKGWANFSYLDITMQKYLVILLGFQY